MPPTRRRIPHAMPPERQPSRPCPSNMTTRPMKFRAGMISTATKPSAALSPIAPIDSLKKKHLLARTTRAAISIVPTEAGLVAARAHRHRTRGRQEGRSHAGAVGAAVVGRGVRGAVVVVDVFGVAEREAGVERVGFKGHRTRVAAMWVMDSRWIGNGGGLRWRIGACGLDKGGLGGGCSTVPWRRGRSL